MSEHNLWNEWRGFL